METERNERRSCPVTDFHTHILPRIDDGSDSLETTRAMLDAIAAQGIRRVAATPHFYPMRNDLSRFLERRRVAMERLFAVREPSRHPEVIPGSETAYYRGISGSARLSALCLTGTRLLLLEMPLCRWSREVVEEVGTLERSAGVRPVLAHIERYAASQRRGTLEYLRESGVLFQSNASFFLSTRTRKRAMRMMSAGLIQFLGSDCHNMTGRRPDLGPALELMEDAGADLGPVVEAERRYLDPIFGE